MCKQVLKNYLEYLKKLERYAKAVNLKIEYKPEIGDGAYIPSRLVIRIDPDLSEADEIATFLHELGHALDDNLVNKEYLHKVNTAYVAMGKERLTAKQRKVILDCEKRAWKYGSVIAKKLKIRLGKWYARIRARALREYRAI